MNNGKRSTYISSPSRKRLPSKRRKSTFWLHARNFFQSYKTAILVVVILLLISTIVQLSYTYTIGKQENVINEIFFTDESVQMYDNKEMYGFIRTQLHGKNIVMLKLKNGGNTKSIIQETYPFISDIRLNKTSASTVIVSVDFHPTEMVLRNEFISIGYSNKFLFHVTDNDAITSGAIFTRLPSYFSGEIVEQHATGYIGLLGPEKIKKDLLLIQESFPPEDILFLIGSQKSIITSANKRVTFDHKRSIAAQLEYINTLHKLDPSGFYEIDATTFPRVIIKKLTGGFPEL